MGSNIQAKWQHLSCGRCDLYIGERAVSNSGATVSFVCQNYLRQLDNFGPCSEKPWPLLCTGARRERGNGTCGQKLCDMQDVLSRRHCWAPPGGTLGDAWYVNGLVQDNVEVAVARAHRLADGVLKRGSQSAPSFPPLRPPTRQAILCQCCRCNHHLACCCRRLCCRHVHS